MPDNIETFLILKYGSIQHAFSAWVLEAKAEFTVDEDLFMQARAKEIYPNLKLLRSRISHSQKD